MPCQWPAHQNCLCDYREAVLRPEALPSLWHRRSRTNTSLMSQMPPVTTIPHCSVATHCYLHSQQGSWYSAPVWATTCPTGKRSVKMIPSPAKGSKTKTLKSTGVFSKPLSFFFSFFFLQTRAHSMWERG